MEKIEKLSVDAYLNTHDRWGVNTHSLEHRYLAEKINEIIDSLDSKSEVTTIKPLDYIVANQDIGIFPEGWAFKYNPIYKKYYSHPDGEKACSLSMEIVKKNIDKFTQLINGSYVDNEGKIKKAINLDDWLEKDY